MKRIISLLKTINNRYLQLIKLFKMLTILRSIYYLIIPKSILRKKVQLKEKLHWYRLGEKVRKKILVKYKHSPYNEIPLEYFPIIEFLKRNKLAMIPYEFPKKYKDFTINVHLDLHKGLKYLYFENKKLYFKRSWSKNKIKNYFNYLLVEQDLESPHRYLSSEFNIAQNDIVIDAGAAEGIFALSIVENVSKIYLFEPDNEWVEALEATFESWSDKIVIIPKFLGKVNNINTVTLDNFFKNIPTINFIKIDVEGHEQDVLLGSEQIIESNRNLKVAVCTYHKQDDETLLQQYLIEREFKTTYSNGYVISYFDSEIDAPYFRRCLIRATKNY